MRKLFFILPFLLSYAFSFCQDITGNWRGNINANGQQILIVFHFYKDSTGQLGGKWDCPPQNAKNLPCDNIIVKTDSVIVGLKIISGFYAGKLISADSIAGTWHQGLGQLPLNIAKVNGGEAFVEPKRPQTPKPPFNYDVKEVVYASEDSTMHYGATFTKPFSSAGPAKRYPAVLLITGSGKQDRDENIFDHKPFAVIADYLTKKGIAVLRVDDRGMGQTTGNFDTSSSEDFAKDVEVGIRYLQSRQDVDARHIGLVGHSEGGMIAPMVAARNKKISFIILLAGTGVPGAVINDYQNVLPLENAGFSKDNIQKFLELHHVLIEAVNSSASADDFKVAVAKIYADWKKQQTAETIGALIKATDDQTILALQTKYGALHTKWWKFFLTHDPAEDLGKLSIPVLAINGDKDVQVDSKTNLHAIKKALEKSKSKNYKTVELPGLNHLFQHCKKCTLEEYGELEETFSPGVLEMMGEWIKGVVQK